MISNLEGEEWKRVRNTITPAFSASKLKVVSYNQGPPSHNTMNRAIKQIISSIKSALGSPGFHDLFNHYLCFFSKHNENCKTEA